MESFWPNQKQSFWYGGCVSNEISNQMIKEFDSISSVNSEIDDSLKKILVKAGLTEQEFQNPEFSTLFQHLMKIQDSPQVQTTKPRITQQQIISRHSTLMPKKSIVVSQLQFQYNNSSLIQNQQKKLRPPKQVSTDLIEQIKNIQHKYTEKNSGNELRMLLENQDNNDYSFSSSSGDDEQ